MVLHIVGAEREKRGERRERKEVGGYIFIWGTDGCKRAFNSVGSNLGSRPRPTRASVALVLISSHLELERPNLCRLVEGEKRLRLCFPTETCCDARIRVCEIFRTTQRMHSVPRCGATGRVPVQG
jgi:hypothetical protein